MSLARPAYEYIATPLRVIDGDTIEVSVDLGFRATITTPLRLLGVNAPEKNTKPGKASLAWSSKWLETYDAPTKGLLIRSAHPGVYGDKYGRWLATVRDCTGTWCLNDDIVAAGMAVRFMV